MEFSSQAVDLGLEAVCAFLSGSLGVDGVIQVALHGGDVGLHAACVACEDGDIKLDFSEAGGGLSQFILGIFEGSFRLWIEI